MKERVQSHSNVSRRHFIGTTAALSAGLMTFPKTIFTSPFADPDTLRYPIGICDVYILKRTSLGAIQRAKDIGVQGLEPDIGSLSKNETFNHDPKKTLLDPAIRKSFIEESKKVGIKFTSLGMVAFLAQDFGTRPTVLTKMIPDAIDTMKALNLKIAYLPLRAKCLVKFPETRPNMVERLKATALLAEKANVIFGIETTYEGADEVKLIDEIGSPSIRSYFNFKNPTEEGRDLIKELKIFGRERICQIHCTEEDGTLLKNNKKIDYKKAYETLNEMGYSGWLVMERGRASGMDITKAYQENAKYLKSVFQGSDVPPITTGLSQSMVGPVKTMFLHTDNGLLHIHIPRNRRLDADVGIFNTHGRLVRSWNQLKVYENAPTTLKPILIRGTYIIRIRLGNHTFSQKFDWLY